jgi:hypothetical protein
LYNRLIFSILKNYYHIMSLTTNTSLDPKDTQLLSVFTSHFKGELNLARVRLMCLFITALCKVKSVNYSKISSGFASASLSSSCFRRVQRFMSEVELPMKCVATLIFKLLPRQDSLVLIMDRTNWKFGSRNINILMIGISYRNVAIPLMFKMLDKRGNSNSDERITLMNDFIGWFGRDCISCLLADREFIGEHWLGFLNHNNIPYHIRIRNNFRIFLPRKQKEVTAWHLFNDLKVNEFRHYEKIVVMHDQLCYLSGVKIVKDGKIEFLILVSFKKPEQSLAYYKQRWQIETLFKAMKSSGFNIEDTHVTALERLEKLILLTMIALVWCYKIGDYIDSEIKPIKIKTHGRRAVSVFKYGLDYLSECLLSGFNKLNINLLQLLSCT